MTIEKTLAERGKTYGPFLDKAKTVQALIDVVIHEPGWERLAADQKQCIMVCFDKFARAIHGDPNHRDNFHDVVGYAKLVDDRMAADELQREKIEYAYSPVGPEDYADGWRGHFGTQRPFGDDDTKFDLRFRRGNELYGVKTGASTWHYSGRMDDDDIVAYRLSR